jgi:hypothetical protein
MHGGGEEGPLRCTAAGRRQEFETIRQLLELIAEFYLVDRGLRHRLPGFSSMGRLVILP